MSSTKDLVFKVCLHKINEELKGAQYRLSEVYNVLEVMKGDSTKYTDKLEDIDRILEPLITMIDEMEEGK